MAREISAEPVAAQVHGSYLVETPREGRSPFWLVGFHGYGENAEQHLQHLRSIPGTESHLLCAVQSLHLFYSSKTQLVVGSWMTRQGRELAITDNRAYVGKVLQRLQERFGTPRHCFLVGFSQGVAMAYRVAVKAQIHVQGLIALAGDVPPDVAEMRNGALPPILLGRGHQDPWYTEGKLESDLNTLETLGVEAEVCHFKGGHEWSSEFHQAASDFIRRRSRRGSDSPAPEATQGE